MKKYAVCARLGLGLMLLVFWGLFGSPLSGVVFLLALTALSAARYSLYPYRLLEVLEIVCCAGFALAWPPALLGLWLPAVGLLEDKWAERENTLLSMDYNDRAARLRLENAMEAAARGSQNAAKLAEISERARIAQDIHDYVGHEITGALIALQTTRKLYEKNDPRAGELLEQCTRRIESASEHLRETVRNLKPARRLGVGTLEEICEGFDFCPVDFSAAGDLSGAAHWELLEANLKETLTNAARHSNATVICVKIDGNAGFIRMEVKDNGTDAGVIAHGLGLSGMKERVRAAGGTLTVNRADGFQVVCVLPKRR